MQEFALTLQSNYSIQFYVDHDSEVERFIIMCVCVPDPVRAIQEIIKPNQLRPALSDDKLHAPILFN